MGLLASLSTAPHLAPIYTLGGAMVGAYYGALEGSGAARGEMEFKQWAVRASSLSIKAQYKGSAVAIQVPATPDTTYGDLMREPMRWARRQGCRQVDGELSYVTDASGQLYDQDLSLQPDAVHGGIVVVVYCAA